MEIMRVIALKKVLVGEIGGVDKQIWSSTRRKQE